MVQVSVIIPALNERPHIERAVASARLAGALEVLVADGGSRDGTPELAAAAGAAVIRSPPGRARQQNAGARRARGDVLLFQHADTRLCGGAIRQIRQAVVRRGRLVGAFQQSIEAAGWAYRVLERGNALRVRLTGLAYGDQGIFVARELFCRRGGFADVPLMEDVELMCRLRIGHWPLLLPGPLFVHPRRWQRYGLVRQTLRNWSLLAAWQAGVSPQRLARAYPRHDAGSRV